MLAAIREEEAMGLQRELDYFIANQERLVERYRDKVLVIKDQQVVGAYDTPIEAYTEAQKKYDLGTFMIQPCSPGPAAYTVTINLDYSAR
jgi:hypothetical protein